MHFIVFWPRKTELEPFEFDARLSVLLILRRFVTAQHENEINSFKFQLYQSSLYSHHGGQNKILKPFSTIRMVQNEPPSHCTSNIGYQSYCIRSKWMCEMVILASWFNDQPKHGSKNHAKCSFVILRCQQHSFNENKLSRASRLHQPEKLMDFTFLEVHMAPKTSWCVFVMTLYIWIIF